MKRQVAVVCAAAVTMFMAVGPASGSTLIVARLNNRVIEVDNSGMVVWQFNTGPGSRPWDAERLANGNTLITVALKNRVIEVNKSGTIVWQTPLGMLNHPMDAERLPSGQTLIADTGNSRVVLVKKPGAPGPPIVWQTPPGLLYYPVDAERLPSGRTLIADTGNNRVVVVKKPGDPGPTIVWQTPPGLLNRPMDAERLPSAHTLIADTGKNRVVVVNAAGVPVWMRPAARPRDAQGLPNGNMLIAHDFRVVEVTPLPGPPVWVRPAAWPADAERLVSEVWVDDDWTCQDDVNDFDPNLIWQYDAFNSVQDAIDALSGSSNTAHVLAGTYNESVTIDKSLTLIGAKAGVSAHGGAWTGGISVIDPGAGNTGIDIQSSDVTVNGFEVTGGVYGIYAGSVDASQVTISYCDLHDNSKYGLQAIGIGSDISFVNVSHNYIHDNGRNGLKLVDVTDCTIMSNEFAYNGFGPAATKPEYKYGVFLEDERYNSPQYSPCIRNTFIGNSFHDNALGAMNMEVMGNATSAHWTSTEFLEGTVVYNNCFSGDSSVWGINVSNDYQDDGSQDGFGPIAAVNAEYNWWGDDSGPYDPVGTTQVPPCGVPVNDMKNVHGLGNLVSDNVDYCPWLKGRPGIVVITLPATNVGKTSATLWGQIVNDIGEPCQYRFWYWTQGAGPCTATAWSSDTKTNSQSFSQDVTGLIPGSRYYFWAQAKNSAGESLWAAPKSFVTLQGLLELVTPNGGQTLLAGSTYEITWKAEPTIGDVLLEYSTDNGGSWNTIDTAANTELFTGHHGGSYPWVVPAASSCECLVRVSDVSDPTTLDLSDTTFCIVTQPVPDVVGMPLTYFGDSLVLMLNFNNAAALGETDTYFVDMSGYNNDGVGQSFDSDEIVLGMYGNAVDLDGIDDYIHVDDSPELNTTVFTIAFWLKADNPTAGTQSLVARGEDWTNDKAQWVIELDDRENPNTAQLWMEGTDDGDHYYGLGTSPLAADTWYHVTATRSIDGTVKIYLNGVKEGEWTGESFTPAIVDTPVTIGARRNRPDVLQDFFDGAIDELRIWNIALSEGEVAEVFASNQYEDAEFTIKSAGFVVGTITHSYNDTVPPGHVISQSPAGGTPAVSGTSVNLVISAGSPAAAPPTVIGRFPTDVGPSSAMLKGQISDDGGGTCEYRFQYRKSGEAHYDATAWYGYKVAPEVFSVEVTGLTPGCKYYFWAQAKNSAGEGPWSAAVPFVTPEP